MNPPPRLFLSVMITALMLPGLHVRADVPLQINGADVKDVLSLYERWTGRKVWVTLDLRADLYFRADGLITIAEAIRFLRTTLLEKYGIELRDSGEKEAFATWSEDPKYKAVRAALIRSQSANPGAKDPQK